MVVCISKSMQKKTDTVISFALVSTYVVLSLQYLILTLGGFIDTYQGELIQMISKIIVGSIYAVALPYVIKLKKMLLIQSYLIVTLIFLFNYLVFEANQKFLVESIFSVYLISLPSFVYVQSISEYSVFKSIMKSASYIVFVSGVILSFLNFIDVVDIGLYSMPLSYYMLLPLIIFIDDLIDGIKIKSIIISSMSLIVIMTLGSRGAILCLIIFILLSIPRLNLKITYKNAGAVVASLIMSILALVNFRYVLTYVNDLLISYGIKSRSLSIFLRGDFYLSGRETIYDKVFEKIVRNPITGIGIMGDRFLLDGGYAHNIFIELLANYGVIFGIILSTLLISMMIFSYASTRNVNKRILNIWMSLGFVHLLVSSSYLIDFRFWIFLGVLFKSTKIYSKHRNEAGSVKKIKVLYLSDSSLQKPGGAQQSMKVLIEGLTKTPEFDVYIISPAGKPINDKNIVLGDFNSFVLKANSLTNNIRISAKIYREIRRISPHIIHVQMTSTAIIINALRRCGLISSNIKIIYTDRGVYGKYGRLTTWSINSLAVHATKFITTTVINKQNYERKFNGYEKHKNKFEVIHNTAGQEYDTFDHSKRDKIRAMYDIKDTTFVIGFCGRFSEQKNWPLATEIIRMSTELTDVKYVLILGSDKSEHDKQSVDQYISMIGNTVGENNLISFIDIDNELVSKLYYAIDCFVMTSKWESFGRTAIEAMSRQTTIIGTGVDGLVEVIGDSKYLYNDAKDAVRIIRDIYYDKDKLNESKKMFFERYHKLFSTKMNLDSYKKLYEEII